MNSNTLAWILIGVGLVFGGLLFLLGSPPEDAAPPVQTAPVAVSPQPVAPIEEETFWEPAACPASETCPSAPEEPCGSPCVKEAPPSDGCSEIPSPCSCTEGCERPLLGVIFPAAEPPHPRDLPKPKIDRHYPPSIDEGSTVPLFAWIENPGCVQVCFAWSVSKGWLEDPDTLTPIYHAPESDRAGGETVTITLTIYDQFGGKRFDQIRIPIRNLDYVAPPVP